MTTPNKRRKAVALLLGLQIFLASYFLDDVNGANQLSRAMPAVTWVLSGTWAIDPLAHFTQDKCVVQGHAYSDKAPLSSWLTVPFVQLGKTLHLGFDKLNLRCVLQAVDVGSVVTGSVPFAGAVVLIALRAAAFAGPYNPVLVACALLYGSFVWAYAGTFFGNMLAAFFLLAAAVTRRNERYVATGALLGCAFLAEYPTAIALGIWSLQLTLRSKRIGPTAAMLAGFLPAVVLIALYNASVTGSPWTMTYKFTAAPEFGAMHTNYGFGLPQPRVVYELLLGPRRGLLFFAPILVLAAISVLKHRGVRSLRAIVTHPEVSVGCALFVLNASYFIWWGGDSFGPRHLVTAAVLWAYAAVEQVRTRPFLWLAAALHTVCWMDKATLAHNIGPNDSAWSALSPDVGMMHYNDGPLLTQLGLMSSTAAVWLWPVLFALCTWASCRLLQKGTSYARSP